MGGRLGMVGAGDSWAMLTNRLQTLEQLNGTDMAKVQAALEQFLLQNPTMMQAAQQLLGGATQSGADESRNSALSAAGGSGGLSSAQLDTLISKLSDTKTLVGAGSSAQSQSFGEDKAPDPQRMARDTLALSQQAQSAHYQQY